MDNFHKYKPTDKMSNVISENYSLISVMSRFGLPLGFGEKTVAEVCNEQGVDCNTFLIVVNFVNEDSYSGEFSFNYDSVSLPALVDYLNDSAGGVAVFVVIDYFDVFKPDLYVDVNVRKVDFFALFCYEVALFVKGAAFVELG